jgi:hypothetical protein
MIMTTANRIALKKERMIFNWQADKLRAENRPLGRKPSLFLRSARFEAAVSGKTQ